MREPIFNGQFKRDFRKVEKRGCDMEKMREIIALLTADAPLPERCKDHALKGRWVTYRDVHIAPDWILIYKKVGDDQIIFARTGTHSDLFAL
jgi:mRNA interferase YafQ